MTPSLPPPWVLVPAKSFARAKSRLAARLDDAARTGIARDMLFGVLAAIEGAGLGSVLVLTDGDDVAAAMAARGVPVLRDAPSPAMAPPAGSPAPGAAPDAGDGAGGLARVVDRGLGEAAARGARRALVVMGDLPRLGAADVLALVAALDDPALVLAPDAQGTGTSALGCWLPAVPTRFGSPRSLALHREDAARRGARVVLVERPGLAFDVDTVDDLDRLGTAAAPQ